MMLGGILKSAWRHIVRHKAYSFINIFGLAIGMACAILILLWATDEYRFDRFHKNIDRLYLLPTHVTKGSKPFSLPGAPPWIMPALKSECPEIAGGARMTLFDFDFAVRRGDKIFMEKIRMADATLLELFTFPLAAGESDSLKSDPHRLLLTEAMAEKYFGKVDPVGKALTLDNRYEFTVAGVLQNIPPHSTLRFDFLVPLPFTEEFLGKGYLGEWGSCRFLTYLLLHPGVSASDLSRKISGRIQKSDPEAMMESLLFPVSNLHLRSLTGKNERIWTVRIVVLFALLILLVSCVNFINLALALGGRRAREAGIRRVAGATRLDLFRRFLAESFLSVAIALLLALFMVQAMLPAFSGLSEKALKLDFGSDWTLLLKVLAIGAACALLAGGYPAWKLSAPRTGMILENIHGSRCTKARFRNVLVVGQFFVSIVLLISAIVVSRQHRFLLSKDLGLNTEQVLCLPLSDALNQTADSFKEGLKSDAWEFSLTRSSGHPALGIITAGEGWQWEGKDPAFNPYISFLNVDEDFFATFQTGMVAGRPFPRGMRPDSYDVVINETFARMMGGDWPVGKRFFVHEDGTQYVYTILGVAKDFNFRTLKFPISPMIISCNWRRYQKFQFMFIKLPERNIRESITRIETIFKRFNPNLPFEYHFLDEDYENLYREEKRLGRIFSLFTLLALFISNLGLFGLAVFFAGQRTREIAIRKVLGASVAKIFLLLSREFLKWVVVANVIAWPVAYLGLSFWLQSFAYRTPITIGVFAVSGVLALLAALLTVGWQALRAARANPAESLRYE